MWYNNFLQKKGCRAVIVYLENIRIVMQAYEMLRAYVHRKHVHKIPLISPALQMLKKLKTYFLYLKRGRLLLAYGLKYAWFHQYTSEVDLERDVSDAH